MVAINNLSAIALGLASTVFAAPQAVTDGGVDFSRLCKGRPMGWFCLDPIIAVLCEEDGKYVKGGTCPRSTCCDIPDRGGTPLCTKRACGFGKSPLPERPIFVEPIPENETTEPGRHREHRSKTPFPWTFPPMNETTKPGKSGEAPESVPSLPATPE